MRGSDLWRMAFWSAVTSGNMGSTWHARRSSTQLPEIIRAPVGTPSTSARPSSPIHAAMSRRDCSCTLPWYARSVTAVAMTYLALFEQHGFDEGLDLVARALERPHLFLELDQHVRDACALEPLLHEHVVEERGLAELRGGEDDGIGPGPADLLDEAVGAVLPSLVPRGARDRAVDVGGAQAREGVAVAGDVVDEPAPAEQEIVLDDVAAGLLEHLEQAEGRLLAEEALEDHAHAVLAAPAPGGQSGQQGVEPDDRLFRRRAGGRAENEVQLCGGELLGLGDAEGVEGTQPRAQPVVRLDRLRQRRLRHRQAELVFDRRGQSTELAGRVGRDGGRRGVLGQMQVLDEGLREVALV